VLGADWLTAGRINKMGGRKVFGAKVVFGCEETKRDNAGRIAPFEKGAMEDLQKTEGKREEQKTRRTGHRQKGGKKGAMLRGAWRNKVWGQGPNEERGEKNCLARKKKKPEGRLRGGKNSKDKRIKKQQRRMREKKRISCGGGEKIIGPSLGKKRKLRF